MELRLNGKVSASGSFTARNMDGTEAASIGAKSDGSLPLDGDVYAVLAWKVALTPTLLGSVETAAMAALQIAPQQQARRVENHFHHRARNSLGPSSEQS